MLQLANDFVGDLLVEAAPAGISMAFVLAHGLALRSLKNRASFPGSGVGGEMRPERPDVGGGPHPKGRNECGGPAQSRGLRHAAAGLEGSAAHPAHRRKAKEGLRRALARRPSEPASAGEAPGIEA